MKQMPILWKRFVSHGETCIRCGDTGRELRAAVSKLETALRPLGITPVLETQEIDEVSFRLCPAESNRVWIAGKPIEEWLSAAIEMTRCCSVCGESNCRALKVGDRTYETIPEDQIIKAGLIAAAGLKGAPEVGSARTGQDETCIRAEECPTLQVSP
jgi:hypothetical protein